MKRLRLLPHAEAPDDCVTWEAWFHLPDGASARVLGDTIEGWDYATELHLRSSASVDLNSVRARSRLAENAAVGIAVGWDCPATLTRQMAAVEVHADIETVLPVRIPPGEAAQEIILERHLVVLEAGNTTDPAAARLPASRLGPSMRNRVTLEGTGGRFPITPIDFSAAGREPAVWALDISYRDLNDSFLGSVRLLVNTAHPAGGLLLSQSSERSDLVSILRYDVVRQFLETMAREGRSLSADNDWVDGSVGDVAEGICEIFLGTDLDSALGRIRTDPAAFNEHLQARLEMLRTVSRE